MFDFRIWNLAAGMAAGALRSLMGWLESNKPFKLRLFTTTLLRSAILGAMMGFGGNQGPVLTFFAVYAGDSVINKSFKIANGGEK